MLCLTPCFAFVHLHDLYSLKDANIEGLTTEFQVFTMWYGIE